MDLLIVGISGPLFDRVCRGIRAAAGPTAPLSCTNYLSPERAQAAREGRIRVISTFDTPASGCNIRETAAALYAQADLLGAPNVMQADRAADPRLLLALFDLPDAPFPELASDPPPEPLLAAAAAYARTGERCVQIWPRALLLDGDNPDQPLPRAISLTGPARNLAYGPYIGFSPGPARLSVVMAVAPTCRHAEMAIELHGSGALGRGLFLLTEPGIFAVELDVVVADAREALEIRLKSERGAIEGELGLDHVELRPV